MFAVRQSAQNRGGFPALVMFMKARRRGGNGVTREEMAGPAGVFGGDDRDLAENSQGAYGDVLEVADRSGDHEQRAGHQRTPNIVPLADRSGAQLDLYCCISLSN